MREDSFGATVGFLATVYEWFSSSLSLMVMMMFSHQQNISSFFSEIELTRGHKKRLKQNSCIIYICAPCDHGHRQAAAGEASGKRTVLCIGIVGAHDPYLTVV